jgi:hypothetical protein
MTKPVCWIMLSVGLAMLAFACTARHDPPRDLYRGVAEVINQ